MVSAAHVSDESCFFTYNSNMLSIDVTRTAVFPRVLLAKTSRIIKIGSKFCNYQDCCNLNANLEANRSNYEWMSDAKRIYEARAR